MTAAGAELHPLSAFLQPWFVAGQPSIAALNAAAADLGLVTGNGLPLKFVPPADAADGPLGYEERAWRRGEVETRAENRHDLFNALIWLTFPRTKAALNRRHFAALSDARRGVRGTLRDALTQFDECGVVVAGTRADLWQALCAHRWQEAFVARREELQRSTCFLVFGHASHDALAAPFIGLCGKAWFLEVDAAWLALPQSAALAKLDARLASEFECRDFAPRDWQPLPLLGIPGATADNEQPDYYADPRQFRAARRMRPGSSLGSR